jgi:hypothetical protein
MDERMSNTHIEFPSPPDKRSSKRHYLAGMIDPIYSAMIIPISAGRDRSLLPQTHTAAKGLLAVDNTFSWTIFMVRFAFLERYKDSLLLSMSAKSD